MSTVTTRLCQYDEPTSRQQGIAKARQSQATILAERNARMIATVEARLDEGVAPLQIATELGYGKLPSLRRNLYNHGRGDLARRLRGAWRTKEKPPECAKDGCPKPALWIEDQGLDPDDEPIAHWGALCRLCQRFEDLCEDLLFLLDPLRGGESDPQRIAWRLGYRRDAQGVETLRMELKRRGRIDLRDMLREDRLNPQRQWPLQGTLHSPRAGLAVYGHVDVPNGLEQAVFKYGVSA